jgi:hypothetical protein
VANLEHISRRRTLIRAGLILLGAVQLSEGLWQLLAPAGWFRDFPYPGAHRSALFGGYSEHDVHDLGAAMTAIGFLLIAAAVALRRSPVRLALATYLVLQLPQATFHFSQ